MPPSFSKRWIAGGCSSLFWVSIYILIILDVERSTQLLPAQASSLCDVFCQSFAADHQDDPHAKDTSWSLGKEFLKLFFLQKLHGFSKEILTSPENPGESDECNGLILRNAHKFSRF